MLKDGCVDFWQVRCAAAANLGCYRTLGCNRAGMKTPKSSTVVGSHVELDDGAFRSGEVGPWGNKRRLGFQREFLQAFLPPGALKQEWGCTRIGERHSKTESQGGCLSERDSRVFLVKMDRLETPGGGLDAFAQPLGLCNNGVRWRSPVVYELRPFLGGPRSVEWGYRASARFPMPRVGWGASVFSAHRIGVDQTAPEHKWKLTTNPFSKGL